MNITVIMPTSYIPSCPSTRIIEQAIRSVQRELPGAKIIVTCDGLSENDPRWTAYHEYIHQLTARKDIEVLPFFSPVHQTGMLPGALNLTTTDLIFYCEHDFVIEPHIQWDKLSDIILSGKANYIKLCGYPRIPPEHEHHMFDRVNYDGCYLIYTTQWSQQPHLARTEWYRQIAREYLYSPGHFIEEQMHGIIASTTWDTFKLAIYNPNKGDMMRWVHLDGRNS